MIIIIIRRRCCFRSGMASIIADYYYIYCTVHAATHECGRRGLSDYCCSGVLHTDCIGTRRGNTRVQNIITVYTVARRHLRATASGIVCPSTVHATVYKKNTTCNYSST